MWWETGWRRGRPPLSGDDLEATHTDTVRFATARLGADADSLAVTRRLLGCAQLTNLRLVLCNVDVTNVLALVRDAAPRALREIDLTLRASVHAPTDMIALAVALGPGLRRLRFVWGPPLDGDDPGRAPVTPRRGRGDDDDDTPVHIGPALVGMLPALPNLVALDLTLVDHWDGWAEDVAAAISGGLVAGLRAARGLRRLRLRLESVVAHPTTARLLAAGIGDVLGRLTHLSLDLVIGGDPYHGDEAPGVIGPLVDLLRLVPGLPLLVELCLALNGNVEDWGFLDVLGHPKAPQAAALRRLSLRLPRTAWPVVPCGFLSRLLVFFLHALLWLFVVVCCDCFSGGGHARVRHTAKCPVYIGALLHAFPNTEFLAMDTLPCFTDASAVIDPMTPTSSPRWKTLRTEIAPHSAPMWTRMIQMAGAALRTLRLRPIETWVQAIDPEDLRVALRPPHRSIRPFSSPPTSILPTYLSYLLRWVGPSGRTSHRSVRAGAESPTVGACTWRTWPPRAPPDCCRSSSTPCPHWTPSRCDATRPTSRTSHPTGGRRRSCLWTPWPSPTACTG